MKKKLLTFGLATTLVLSMLAGCGKTADSNEQASESEETVEATTEEVATEEAATEAATTEEAAEELESGTVTLTVWAEENNFEMLTTMIENFKAEHAGEADFDIQLAQQNDSSTKDTMLGDIHAAADVFSFPDDQLTSLIAAGALTEVPNADEISSANLEEAVNAASYNGTLYAYPMTADNGYFLFYDKSYFSDADLATLDGILSVCESSGKKFSMEFTSGWYLYTFFGCTGLEFGINDDGVTNYCNWNTTEGDITGMDVVNSLLDITSSSAFLSESDDDFVAGVQNGSVIAGISGVWNAVAIKEAWGDNYGAVKLPTFTCAGQQVQMSSFTGYKMMGVNYYSAHRDWALKLADYLTNEENQTLRFQERSQGPSNINAGASDEVGQEPAIAAVIDQSQYGNLQRVGNSYWDACTDFANTILSGVPSGETWQDVLDTLVGGITASTVG